jgi:hypothetical protein
MKRIELPKQPAQEVHFCDCQPQCHFQNVGEMSPSSSLHCFLQKKRPCGTHFPKEKATMAVIALPKIQT